MPTHPPTPEQRAIIKAHSGPHRVVAGPGSGKTSTLVERVADMLRAGINPGQMLALTFSRKAAEHLRLRIRQQAGPDVDTFTYHSFAANIAAQYGDSRPTVLSGAEMWLRVDSLARAHSLLGFQEDQIRSVSGNALTFIARMQQELVTPEDLERYLANPPAPPPGSEPGEWNLRLERLATLSALYASYQEGKRRDTREDFGDQLTSAIALLWTQPDARASIQTRYPYVMVDEYQDTNFAQGVLVALLVGPDANVLVVADENQSIYGFQGANPRNVRGFDDLPTLVGHPVTQHSLTGNFRSVPPIVRFSRRVIDAGEELRSVRVIEQPRTDQGVHLVECDRRDHEGTFIVHTIVRQREADPALRWSDVAILAANSSAFPSVVHALRQASIPYEFVGRSDILHLSQARDVLAYARLVDEPTDRLALARVLRQPPLALSHASIRQLLHHHVTAGGVSPLIHSRDLPEPARQRVEDLRQWLDEVRRQDRFDGVRWVLRQILDYTGIESAVATARVADSDLVRSALQRLLDVAQEIDEAGEPLTTFLQYLDVLVARDEDPGESEPSGEDTVKVLTIHAAKGLEWPVVFIADATRLPRSPREAVVRLSREPATLAWESLGTGHWNDANRLALDLDAMTLFSAAPAADHEQEERRLAYVGVTRAADVLYLTVPAGQAARSSLSATGTRILEYMKQTRQWRVTKNSATARSYFGSWLSAQLLDTSLARFWKASETLAYTNAPPASLQQRIDQHRYLAGLLALIDSDQPVSFSPTVLARAAELAAQAPQVRSGGTSS